MKVYTKFGDKIRGDRVYAQFRDYVPKSGPETIEGTDRKRYTLIKTVQCWVTKSLRKI